MLTFADCQKLLGSRTSKKLENNAYLVPLRGEFPNVTEHGARLHNTHVVKIYPDKYVLTTGGWQTVTTKDRLNKHGPVRITQRKGAWYWYDRFTDMGHVFQDGLTVACISGELV